MDAEQQEQENAGFENALAAFSKEEPGAPNAAVEGEVAKAPPPEPPPEAEPDKEAAPKTEPEKLEDEFIEFTGKQKERFNSVYGALKRLERENAELQRRVQQPAPVVSQPAPAGQPQLFTEPRPKRESFDGDDTAWVQADNDWAARKAEFSAYNRSQQEFTQQQTLQQKRAEEARLQQFLEAKTNEGYQKFGQEAFNDVCTDVANFAPYGSLMNQALFGLHRYADVVMELGKNLPEADRIARLQPHDQIYELKALEKKIVAKAELALKAQKPNPTKVEAPGQGEDPKTSPSMAKLKHAAYASGSLRDVAKIFEADPTL